MRHPLLSRIRVRFVVYVLLSFALMAAGQSFPTLFHQPRTQMVTALAPALDVLSAPGRGWIYLRESITLHFNLLEETRKLRAKQHTFDEVQHRLRILREENRHLRALLDTSKEFTGTPVAVRPLSDSTSPFARSILVSAGADKNIEKGHEVLGENGLVGRVVEVFPRHARVLLLTDYTFRLPVNVLEARVRGLARGTNEDTLELILQEHKANIQTGMTVVTSGIDGLFTPNIPVGLVERAGDKILIHPESNFSRLNHVVIQRRKPQGFLSDARETTP